VPWVRKAGIARHWPDRLVVTIEEHVPAALWHDGRGINAQGEWFVTNPGELEPYRDLPELSGPPGTEQRLLARLNDLVAWFAPLGMKPRTVELTSRYAWRVTMENGMVVELGREPEPSVLKERVTRFVTHFAAVHRHWGGMPTYADLRYPNGFAVKIPGVKFIQP
jgi:cell division protein FtsQ